MTPSAVEKNNRSDGDLYTAAQIGGNIQILTLIEVFVGKIIKYTALITFLHKFKHVLIF